MCVCVWVYAHTHTWVCVYGWAAGQVGESQLFCHTMWVPQTEFRLRSDLVGSTFTGTAISLMHGLLFRKLVWSWRDMSVSKVLTLKTWGPACLWSPKAMVKRWACQGLHGSASGPLCISYGFQVSVSRILKFANEWVSDSYAFFSVLFFLLACLVQLWRDCFCFTLLYVMLLCFVLSLRKLVLF